MSHSVNNREVLKQLVYNKEITTLNQTHDSNAKRKQNEDLKNSFINNEDRIRAAKGIAYALIICILFWILLIMVVGCLI